MHRLTKGYMLRSAIGFILRGVYLHVGKRIVKPELTEAQRYDIADQVVRKLREEGWKELDDEMPPTEGLTGPSKR